MKPGHDEAWRARLTRARRAWKTFEYRVRFGPSRHHGANTSAARLHPHSWRKLSFILVTLTLTGSIGQKFYNQPELSVGSIAPYTIEASASARVENPEETEALKRNARRGADPVLVTDPELTAEIYRQFDREIERVTALRAVAGSFPYVKNDILSNPAQTFLRRCSDERWREILRNLNLNSDDLEFDAESDDFSLRQPDLASSPFLSSTLPASTSPPRNVRPLMVELGDMFDLEANASFAPEQASRELLAYRDRVADQEFRQVLAAIVRARRRYRAAIAMIDDTLSPDNSRFIPVIFEFTDLEWQQLLRRSRQAIIQITTQGIPAGLPSETIANAARLHLSNFNLTRIARDLGEQWITQAARPNLTIDPEQSRERAELAANKIEPVFVTIKQGETIIRAGETISPEQFILLDHFNTVQRDPVSWGGLMRFGVVVIVVLSAYGWVESRSRTKLGLRDRVLLLSISLSAPILVGFSAPTTSLAAIGLMSGSFYGSWLGAATVFGLAVLLPLGLNLEIGLLISGALGGLFGAAMAERLRSREELALLGLGIGLVQGITYGLVTLIELLVGGSSGLVWSLLLGEALLQGAWGVASGILVLGLSPYLEHLFDVVTPVRLAELANPNRPLLKRLAAEAPGTFQHTLFVATLAESAAKALNCNVELVRTGTLYHDIGKMHDPLGFVENQMGGVNKHDTINDPFISAQIIEKHVSEGLAMARKSRLPQAVQAFIPEHQGTMLIAYFYYQAKQNNSGKGVREEDFRYAGPIPQSRETGIVMLADSCEAALRSLKDASYEDALNMVNKILRARWQDGQLRESNLTRAEMGKIAEIFVQVWQQYHHKRIAYPKAALTNNP
ncbi:MAG: HDIG domain-containing protein [Oscillatoriales cyanobacterium]|nr:MAG: HDIG domain-containing protein [Oscillatoriales cyanobacterium]